MVHFSKMVGAATIVVSYLTGPAIAHPWEHHDHENIKRQVQIRDQMASMAKRSLDTCSSSLKHRELAARSISRRAAVAQELRQRRNIQNRKSNLFLHLRNTYISSLQPPRNTVGILRLLKHMRPSTTIRRDQSTSPHQLLRARSSLRIHLVFYLQRSLMGHTM